MLNKIRVVLFIIILPLLDFWGQDEKQPCRQSLTTGYSDGASLPIKTPSASYHSSNPLSRLSLKSWKGRNEKERGRKYAGQTGGQQREQFFIRYIFASRTGRRGPLFQKLRALLS
jgi:hypothetical protein